jgi:hypothetical protein
VQKPRASRKELIDAEAQLDSLFAYKRIDDRALQTVATADRAAAARNCGQTHLHAHRKQTALLSAAQRMRATSQLRGYGQPQNQTMHEHH